jgi:hypothetical protein
MSTVLPPIGAKIRVTTTWPGDASLIVEGRVLSHAPSGRYAMVGRGGARTLTAYLTDDEGGAVTVEVLEPPLPPEPGDGTVYRCSRPVPGAVVDGAQISWLLWRKDGWEANGDGRRWFKSATGAEDALLWAEVQPLDDEHRVELVPDPAASAPELPWSISDQHGDTLTFRTNQAGDRLMVGINDEGNDYVNLFPNDAAAAGRALLRWAGEHR